MKQFDKNILDAIGNTPIIKLQKVAKHIESNIYVKLEYLNPGGSIKDRIGRHICQKAMDSGELKPGGIIVEATSGNTGVGICLFASVHKCKAVFVMADKQSPEKIQALKAMGAQVVLCPTNVEPEVPRSYYSVAKVLSENLENSFYANQYHNENNREAHFTSTGPEIFEQTEGKFDAFVAGVGTGGTISGTGAYLKSKMPNVKIVGVDIKGSILAHYHKTGEMIPAHSYVLEGLGEDFLPGNVRFDVIDDFIVVEDAESFTMTREMLEQEGIYAGGSCGAAVCGAIRYAEGLKKPQDILVILPDSGSRYLSKIYNNQWMNSHNYKLPKQDDDFKSKVSSLIGEGVRLM
jgi:cystathionine beta-synthase